MFLDHESWAMSSGSLEAWRVPWLLTDRQAFMQAYHSQTSLICLAVQLSLWFWILLSHWNHQLFQVPLEHKSWRSWMLQDGINAHNVEPEARGISTETWDVEEKISILLSIKKCNFSIMYHTGCHLVSIPIGVWVSLDKTQSQSWNMLKPQGTIRMRVSQDQ